MTSMMPGYNGGAFVKGGLQRWRDHTTCDRCANTRTHKRIMWGQLSPITRKDKHGNFIVYKGFCLEGTCYSLFEAKQLLGEEQHSPSSESWAQKAPSPLPSPVPEAPPSPPLSQPSAPPQQQRRPNSRRRCTDVDDDYQALSNQPPQRVNSNQLGHSTSVDEAQTEPSPPAGEGINRSSFDASQSHSSRPRRAEIPLLTFDYHRPRSDVDEPQTVNQPAPPASELQSIIENLERLASKKDYVEFFNAWSSSKENSQVVRSACEFLLASVEQADQERPDSVILAGNNWVKIFIESMNRHREDAVTVFEVMSTILVLSKVRKSYRKNMTNPGLVESVLKSMSFYEQDFQPLPGPTFCEFFERLSCDEKEGLNIKHQWVLKVIQSIAGYLRPNHEGREYATRALYNFVCHKKKSEVTANDLKHDIARHLAKSDTAQFLRDILEGTKEETTAVAVVGLWHRLSSIDEHPVGLSEGIRATSSVWQKFRSESLSSEVCGFFSNLVWSPTFPMEWVDHVHSLLGQCMHSYPCGTTVQLYGMRSLCRMLENSDFQDQVFGDVNMLDGVLRLVHDAVLHLLENCDDSLPMIVVEMEPLCRFPRLALELSRSGIVGRLEVGSQMQRLKEPTKKILDIVLAKCHAAKEEHEQALVLNSTTPESFAGVTEGRQKEHTSGLGERMNCLIEIGEFSLFLDILESNGADLEVAKSGLELIRTIIGILDLETIRSIGVPLTSMLISLFRTHVGNVSLLTSILEIVRELCRRDEHLTSLLLEADLFAFIIQTMEIHIGSFEVQIESIRLMNMLSVTEGSQIVIGSSGGCAIIITAMHVHQESAKLQTLAIGTLRNLTALTFNREMIEQAEGESAIVGAIVMHNMDSVLISSAFMALNDLIVSMDNQTVAQIRNESLDSILVAMQTFPHDESVQRSACILLKSIAYEPRNLQKLLKRKDNLKQMLKRVALEFPQACGKRACDVIKKICRDEPHDCGGRTSVGAIRTRAPIHISAGTKRTKI
jgi:hypothetical protein